MVLRQNFPEPAADIPAADAADAVRAIADSAAAVARSFRIMLSMCFQPSERMHA